MIDRLNLICRPMRARVGQIEIEIEEKDLPVYIVVHRNGESIALPTGEYHITGVFQHSAHHNTVYLQRKVERKIQQTMPRFELLTQGVTK